MGSHKAVSHFSVPEVLTQHRWIGGATVTPELIGSGVPSNIPPYALRAIIEAGERDLVPWKSGHIVVTGASGFVGLWLIHALYAANSSLKLGLRVTALVRDPTRFSMLSPEVAAWANVVRGDILDLPPFDRADAYIHAAAPTSIAAAGGSESTLRKTIVDGTRSVITAASENGAIPFLLTSSGAVYGHRGSARGPISECASLGDHSQMNPYAEAKREAESLALEVSNAGGPSLRLPRLFSFIGPHMSLDGPFAAGNFIRDAVLGKPITISGNATATRSFLYAGDMVLALIAILARGERNRPYNVGSSDSISVLELAEIVRHSIAPASSIELPTGVGVVASTSAPSYYVPDTSRVETELSVAQTTSLEVAITETANWARVGLLSV